MNANELADEQLIVTIEQPTINILKKAGCFRNAELLQELVNRYKQQQAEIERLKSSNNILKTELINKEMGYR